MANEELLIQLHHLEQQANQLQQYLHIFDQQIATLKQLSLGLDALKDAKNKEILSPLAKDMFVKTQLIDDHILVDIGHGNFVRKNTQESQEFIQEQISSLDKLKIGIVDDLEKLNLQLQALLEEAQERQRAEEKNEGIN
jgi:prefoldin alpha subunit